MTGQVRTMKAAQRAAIRCRQVRAGAVLSWSQSTGTTYWEGAARFKSVRAVPTNQALVLSSNFTRNFSPESLVVSTCPRLPVVFSSTRSPCWNALEFAMLGNVAHFPAWKKPEDASGPITYHKGAYVLHLLRQRIGDEAFWAGLRAFAGRYRGWMAAKNASINPRL